MRRNFLMLTALALLLTACGGDETAGGDTAGGEGATADECAPGNLATFEDSTLTVATGEPAFEPWVVDDDPTNGQGFESAVVYALADQLGYGEDQVTWVRTGFDEATAPGSKDYDFNIQQFSIIDEREEVVDFSRPYYVTNQALVAYDGSPAASAESIGDLVGTNLGAQLGTTSLSYIEEVIQPETPAAVYDTNVDAKSALDANQVDGLVFDLPTAYFITAVEIPEASIVGVFEVSEDQADRFGLLFEEGSAIVDCVDAGLDELDSNGTLESLAAEWLEQAGDIPTITG